ncbi:hypothetical protein BK732_30565 [Bacillus thuringiensis serovar navarrensis]|uniref:Uncharacterized protein n=1 Tax=Bacillus thuringiensis serovar navarrensis TaxID=339658 RepID=A0A243A332_BACTU|nr:hypothetical protein BK732_30565 [Bacillus thuringiensis serovar navarrensis]
MWRRHRYLLVFMLKRKNYRAAIVLVVCLIYTILVSFTSYMSFLDYAINTIIVIFLGISFFLAVIFEKEK